MTIAATDREVRNLIREHHIVGAEAVVNALARATKEEKYLDREAIIRMLDHELEWLEREKKEGGF